MDAITEFGEKVLAILKDNIATGLMSEEDEFLAGIAVSLGLIKYEPYDPEKHLNVDADYLDFEPGDMIYYWG